MALVWVAVVRSDGRGIGDGFFVDGEYVDVAGFLGTPLKVRTGSRLFEIFGTDDKIAWQTRHICRRSRLNSETHPIVVTLEPADSGMGP